MSKTATAQLSMKDMVDLGDLLEALRRDIYLNNRDNEVSIRQAMIEILKNNPIHASKLVET